MRLATGSHRLGPDSGSLQVKTYREGMVARAGHDLTLEIARWEARLDVGEDLAGATVELSADPRSVEVVEGVGGVKPLTDRDRAEIRKTIDGKVLRGRPIEFRSTAVRPAEGGLVVDGDLTLNDQTRAVSVRLGAGPDGRLRAEVPVRQSTWGITPYRGLMGALKLRDEVDVIVGARLPPG